MECLQRQLSTNLKENKYEAEFRIYIKQNLILERRLMEKLLNNIDDINLSFTADEFPPEKSIYLTLLKKTKIHRVTNGVGILTKSTDETFDQLWKAGEKFLASTKHKERNLNDFVTLLSNRPFKLKQGFLDFWVPIFLIVKTEDYALFNINGYIPNLTVEVFDIMYKSPHKFWVKAFDISGIKLEVFNKYKIKYHKFQLVILHSLKKYVPQMMN